MYSEFFKRDLTDQEIEDLREFTAGAKPGDTEEFFGVVMQCEGSDIFKPCSNCIFKRDRDVCFCAIDCTRPSINFIFTVKQ